MFLLLHGARALHRREGDRARSTGAVLPEPRVGRRQVPVGLRRPVVDHRCAATQRPGSTGSTGSPRSRTARSGRTRRTGCAPTLSPAATARRLPGDHPHAHDRAAPGAARDAPAERQVDHRDDAHRRRGNSSPGNSANETRPGGSGRSSRLPRREWRTTMTTTAMASRTRGDHSGDDPGAPSLVRAGRSRESPRGRPASSRPPPFGGLAGIGTSPTGFSALRRDDLGFGGGAGVYRVAAGTRCARPRWSARSVGRQRPVARGWRRRRLRATGNMEHRRIRVPGSARRRNLSFSRIRLTP